MRWILAPLLFFSVVATASVTWRPLSDGIEYTHLDYKRGIRTGHIHAFRLDPRKFKLKLAFSKDYPGLIASAHQMMRAEHGVIAINGGFFTPELQSLGLRISEGKLHQPLRSVRWWGVFTQRGGWTEILPLQGYRYRKDIDFAIQAGPRLVINGHIPGLRGKAANRTALGITREHKLIIAATENLPIKTSELADVMRAKERLGGLNCRDALNLDGGSSTQMYAHIGDFRLSVPTFVPIADAVIVVPR